MSKKCRLVYDVDPFLEQYGFKTLKLKRQARLNDQDENQIVHYKIDRCKIFKKLICVVWCVVRYVV